MFTTKHYSFSWESFLIRTHKYTFEASRDLIDAIRLFPYWSFEKLNLHFDFKNNLMFIQNNNFDILLVEWCMNQATPSLRWLKKKKRNE
jgi:hypothetical protein